MFRKFQKKSRKKPKKKMIWISRKAERLQMCLENFKARLGKKHNFKNCINKLKMSVEHTMKRSFKKKPGGKEQTLKAAPWVDKELIDNIEIRSKYSRKWRYARKKGDAEEIEECKRKYFQQKKVTAKMTQDKKSKWEERMIAETEHNPQAF